MSKITFNRAEEIILDIVEELEQSYNHPVCWRKMREQDIWTELIACILGSQVSYEHAKSALAHLKEMGLLNAKEIVINPLIYEKSISQELSKPLYRPKRANGLGRKYRYPIIRARHICQTTLSVYNSGNSLKLMLHRARDEKSVRNTIMKYCKGIGPKQASLFLRNIGFGTNLAIIDTHIFNFMKHKNLITESIDNIKSKYDYFNIEKDFIQYAESKNVSPGNLDLAIWAVMSEAKLGGKQ
ncbi:hypothetical protein KAR91_10405 [Candidatus Pacearchaeota archaeon]|nr:hypothetical protein [Candidatus Pacearchaeota archaeon]